MGTFKPLPCCLFSLDKEDNDLERFFRYLLAAWETVQPEIVESQLGTLLGAMSPDNEAVLAAFINVANDFHQAEQGGTWLAPAAAKAFYQAILFTDDDEHSFAHPYHWAAFTFSGV